MAKTKVDPLDNHVSGQSNKPMTRPAHALSYNDVIQQVNGNPKDGLTAAEATLRMEEFGPNELGDAGGVQPVKILIRQVANAMTLVMRTISPLVWEQSG